MGLYWLCFGIPELLFHLLFNEVWIYIKVLYTKHQRTGSRFANAFNIDRYSYESLNKIAQQMDGESFDMIKTDELTTMVYDQRVEPVEERFLAASARGKKSGTVTPHTLYNDPGLSIGNSVNSSVVAFKDILLRQNTVRTIVQGGLSESQRSWVDILEAARKMKKIKEEKIKVAIRNFLLRFPHEDDEELKVIDINYMLQHQQVKFDSGSSVIRGLLVPNHTEVAKAIANYRGDDNELSKQMERAKKKQKKVLLPRLRKKKKMKGK
eukprot:CAMPEP_0114989616 /NCGR_PEP_ID=MMETSP0216-20121206/10299_1 /TAXON_ID=223996 /ORGANISM="Protocruzia adherens, Strain Boccale" /LENGTH=265 /DNA_ID=CAMNT_0002352619 /DNA_START=511 /DNA_END=1308 /DNA_ORIENTATION=+